MAGASGKARFYLEQSIPELQELERKKLFSKDEISSIAKKRSEFEHKVNARGSQPSDYARYAEYEMNLESLRLKRVKRTGVKAAGYSGQKRILFILERATRKFHGDLGLWMQYLEYSKHQRAYKKVAQIFTTLLRLHPTKPELWISAAKYVIDEQGDMAGARSYMQRGLRFCKQSKDLWLEYAKLELMCMAKISARQKILGLSSESQKDQAGKDIQDEDANHIALPAITAKDFDPSLRRDDVADNHILYKLSSSPALSGAISIAIFDAGLEVFQDTDFAEKYFNLVADFANSSCSGPISKHITEALNRLDMNDAISMSCSIQQPLIGISHTSPDFPVVLSSVLKRLKRGLGSQPSLDLFEKIDVWLLRYLTLPDLDPDIKLVISATLDRIMEQYKAILQTQGGGSGDRTVKMLGHFQKAGAENLISSMVSFSLKIWPSNVGLLALRSSAIPMPAITQ